MDALSPVQVARKAFCEACCCEATATAKTPLAGVLRGSGRFRAHAEPAKLAKPLGVRQPLALWPKARLANRRVHAESRRSPPFADFLFVAVAGRSLVPSGAEATAIQTLARWREASESREAHGLTQPMLTSHFLDCHYCAIVAWARSHAKSVLLAGTWTFSSLTVGTPDCCGKRVCGLRQR